MAHFCHQISFTSTAWQRVLQNSNDRFEFVRTPVESLGGKLVAAFFARDSYDVLLISEFSEDVSPSAISIQFFSAGHIAHIHTTQLLGPSELQETVQKASLGSHRPAPRERALAVTAS